MPLFYALGLFLLLSLCPTLFATEKTSSPACGELAARVFAAHNKKESLAHIAQVYQELWQSLAPETSPAQFEALSKGDPLALPETLRVKYLVLDESLQELKSLTQKAGLDPQEVRKTLQRTIAQWGKKIEDTEKRIRIPGPISPIEQPVRLGPKIEHLHSNWDRTILVAKRNSRYQRIHHQNIVEVHTGRGQKQVYSFSACQRIDEMAIANDGTLYLAADGWLWKTTLLSPNKRLKRNPVLEKWKPFSAYQLLQLSPDEKFLQGVSVEDYLMEIVSLREEEVQFIHSKKREAQYNSQGEDSFLFSRFLNGVNGDRFGLTLHYSGNPTKDPRKEAFRLVHLDRNGKLSQEDLLSGDALPQEFVPRSVSPLIPSSDPNHVSFLLERQLLPTASSLREDILPVLMHLDLKNKKRKIIPWKGVLQNPLFRQDHDTFLHVLGQLGKNTHVLLQKEYDKERKYLYYLADPQTGETRELNLANLFPERGKDAGFYIRSTFPGTNHVILVNEENEAFTADLTPYLP